MKNRYLMEFEIPIILPDPDLVERIRKSIDRGSTIHHFEVKRGVENNISGFGVQESEDIHSVAKNVREGIWAELGVYVDVNLRFLPIVEAGSTSFVGDARKEYVEWRERK